MNAKDHSQSEGLRVHQSVSGWISLAPPLPHTLLKEKLKGSKQKKSQRHKKKEGGHPHPPQEVPLPHKILKDKLEDPANKKM